MKKFMFVALAMILTLSAFGVRQAQAAPVEPPITGGPPVLVALLSGPAIDGVVPSGKAEFAAFKNTTALEIRISNLNLADGTCLNMAFGRTVTEGTGVRNGGAGLSFFPSPEAVHPGELITISIGEPPAGQSGCGITLPPATGTVLAPAVGTVILSGTFQAGSGTK